MLSLVDFFLDKEIDLTTLGSQLGEVLNTLSRRSLASQRQEAFSAGTASGDVQPLSGVCTAFAFSKSANLPATRPAINIFNPAVPFGGFLFGRTEQQFVWELGSRMLRERSF